jgi:superoxide dismutase, Fe-Mn family
MKTIYTLPYIEIDGFLSALQLSEHYKLYEGYYNQARDLPAKVNGMGATENWAGIRGIQKTLQYALSGRELHEIYFDLMSPTPTNYETEASELLKQSITNCFGSIEGFVSDMTAAAKMSRGWYRLELDLINHRLYHNVGDFHDEGSTSGFWPVIALDMYDHAYFYDYQTNKGKYIEQFIAHLDWKKVSTRLENGAH